MAKGIWLQARGRHFIEKDEDGLRVQDFWQKGSGEDIDGCKQRVQGLGTKP